MSPDLVLLCSDVKRLELELRKVESGLELTEMEERNKENLSSKKLTTGDKFGIPKILEGGSLIQSCRRR